MINNILSTTAYVIYIILSLLFTFLLAGSVMDKINYKPRCTGDIGESIFKIVCLIIAGFLFSGALIFFYAYFKLAMFFIVIIGLLAMAVHYFDMAGKGV